MEMGGGGPATAKGEDSEWAALRRWCVCLSVCLRRDGNAVCQSTDSMRACLINTRAHACRWDAAGVQLTGWLDAASERFAERRRLVLGLAGACVRGDGIDVGLDPAHHPC